MGRNLGGDQGFSQQTREAAEGNIGSLGRPLMTDQLPMAVERCEGRRDGLEKCFIIYMPNMPFGGVIVRLSPFPLVFISRKLSNSLGLINSFGGYFQVSLVMK